MNHLAHCFLSFGDPDLLVGNFIADEVKGRAWQQYAPGVQRGILLHRAIDAFTDQHPAVRQSVVRLRPFAGRYAGAVTDILYDYLLAGQWEQYAADPFAAFLEKTYDVLAARRPEMPDPLRTRVVRMLAGDFLTGYTRRDGLEWVLDRFSRRLPAGFDWRALWAFFLENETVFAADFAAFFPELLRHAEAFLAANPSGNFNQVAE